MYPRYEGEAMTHDELQNLALTIEKQYGCAYVVKEINKFLESNVVIPKGKNPHRYRDELHKLAEGIYNCECQIELLRPSNIEQVTLKFNIKPEPVYEWQWCVIMDDGTGSIFGFHTEEAINGIFPNRKKIRLGDTMKERKL